MTDKVTVAQLDELREKGETLVFTTVETVANSVATYLLTKADTLFDKLENFLYEHDLVDV